jgi:hypothetical protein
MGGKSVSNVKIALMLTDSDGGTPANRDSPREAAQAIPFSTARRYSSVK